MDRVTNDVYATNSDMDIVLERFRGWLAELARRSLSGVRTSAAGAQSSSGLAVISCQKVRSFATRSVGSFLAMIAELMALIETLTTQLGWIQWPVCAAPPGLTLRRLSASGTAASASSVSTQKASM